jgi:hypothetical protein
MSRRGSRQFAELPQPAIADVLAALGADPADIPTGFGWVRLRCPFCEDRSGSASVNHDADAFTCHQCGVKGDALKLLQTQLGLSFAEALKRASELSPSSGNSPSRRSRNRRPSDLLKKGIQ